MLVIQHEDITDNIPFHELIEYLQKKFISKSFIKAVKEYDTYIKEKELQIKDVWYMYYDNLKKYVIYGSIGTDRTRIRKTVVLANADARDEFFEKFEVERKRIGTIWTGKL